MFLGYFILLLAVSQVLTFEIDPKCLYGEIDAETCCKEVPDEEDVSLRNPANCGTYYICVHQVPLLQDCPSGLQWSVSENRCDLPELANCNSTTTEQPATTTEEVSTTTEQITSTQQTTTTGNPIEPTECKTDPYWSGVSWKFIAQDPIVTKPFISICGKTIEML